MSFLQIDNIEDIDIKKNDELDVVATSSLVVPTRTSQLPADDSMGNALRPRRSVGNTITIPAQRKRPRTLSNSTIENHRKEAKKLKSECKKAVRVPEPPHLFPE